MILPSRQVNKENLIIYNKIDIHNYLSTHYSIIFPYGLERNKIFSF